MIRGLLAFPLFAALALCAATTPTQAFTPTPCVLDKCLQGASPQGSPAPTAPLNPPPAQAPAPFAPGAAGAVEVAPGDFDFYLLTLSWSPGFCDSGGSQKSPDQCAIGSGLAFVVHGLWPQNQQGYPSDCDSNARAPSQIALQETHGVFPNEGLARYEWRKHGTCTGLSPQAYFAAVRHARDSIVIPDAFQSPREQQSVTPRDVMRAFTAANRGLRQDTMAIGCMHGELQDVRFCISKDLRQFVSCPDVARRTCRAQQIDVAPVH
jgi:ribonuclease T2